MELTLSDVAKFKDLCKKHFSIDLDDHEARHKLSLLVRQMEIVYRPVTAEQIAELITDDEAYSKPRPKSSRRNSETQ